MQLVEIPRLKTKDVFDLYGKPDKTYIDIVTAEDKVKVATLFQIHKEKSLEDYMTKNNLVKVGEDDTGVGDSQQKI